MRAVGISSSAASVAIVSVPGVATSSVGIGSSGSTSGLRTARDLLVGGVAAGVAEDERVLAVLVEDHELVRAAAAHHADVARHGDRLQPEPGEDPLVRPVVKLVAVVQPSLVDVEL